MVPWIASSATSMPMFGGTVLLTLLASVSSISGSFAQPDAAKWAALNATVQGRLINGIPFARSCFQQAAPGTLGSFNAERCETVKDHYMDHFALTDDFGGFINTQWETCQNTGASCLLDWTNPNNSAADNPPRVCSQGSVPQFAINVSGPQDVIAGLNFSKATGVPLVIKNTGHDLEGRSGAPGALSLWVHNLKSIKLENNFIPQSCPRTAVGKHAVTYGAGVQFVDLLAFADANKVTIPTGGCISVGAGGAYVPGGGHSVISNTFGLAVDRVLEYELVTPQGEHLFVNQCSHPDLFWALRGGGGGTFGVVLKVTTSVFPEQTFVGAVATYNSSSASDRRQFFQFVTNHSLEMAQQGWGSYVLPGIFILANPKLSLSDANKAMAPLQAFMTSIEGTFKLTVEPNYKALFDNYITLANVPSGLPFSIASRFIPVENFETSDKRNALSDALDSIADKVDITSIFVTTPFLFGENNQTSINPVWRTSLWQVTLSNIWNFDTSVADISTKYSELTAAADILRAMTPGSGGYINEADVYEPDFEASFWGDNYPRLLQIKNKYDPEHLLDVWHGVGWKGKQDSRYKCYI
ncbi:FAD-binding domain-containing protein [Mycena floridula]|nr:FAD-binding domain-containing protein [Mycena floridula]